ncbi:MAG TPA: ParB/Srx family N-terminal domain-containing protein [Actinophytocola sp.]|jgi:hypothetical protein|nr:ParB/Srx family N-terminal domain-containing protein [Actinophytocola sp.]
MAKQSTRRRTGLLLAGALAAVTIGSVPVLAGATDTAPARHRVAAGDLIDVTLGELHPTQPAVGFDEIYYKLGRYASDKDEQAGHVNKRFDDWCEANGQQEADSAGPGASLTDPASFTCTVPVGQETPETTAAMKTVVIGPGGVRYLTDGHHSFTELMESPDGGPSTHIRVRVVADLSGLDQDAFWTRMQDEHWVWLRDANDQPITADQLPATLGLGSLGDDRYRSLVYFTRDIGYQQPAADDGGSPEFLEFYWAHWLRESYDLADHDLTDHDDYLGLIEDASKDMTKLGKDDEVADGRTAGELGRMSDWNDGKSDKNGEFGDLAKPMSDDEPGKLAYALDYKSEHA